MSNNFEVLSIVIPTLGREKEVENLLESIYQNVKSESYEVVVVDQNFSKLLDSIIEKYKKSMHLRHYKVSFRGLSKAKNYGIEKSHGDFILFMDDDAEILPDSIEKAVTYLSLNPGVEAISGRMVDRDGKDSVKIFSDVRASLNLKNFEDKFIESSMTFRRSCLINERFDDNLGCGTFHGAEEGFDLIYRLLRQGATIHYDPSIKFYHPRTISTHSSDSEIRRVFSYRCGFAALCKKHGFNKRYYSRIIKIALYLPFLAVFNRKKIRYYSVELLGLICGRLIK